MHLNYVYQNNGIQTIFCTRLKTIPSSRIRTSDLRMPVLSRYSPPLYQLSYRRHWAPIYCLIPYTTHYKLIILFRSVIIYNIPVCFLQTVYFRSPGNEVPHTLIVTHGRSFVQSSLVVVVIHLNVHFELLY